MAMGNRRASHGIAVSTLFAAVSLLYGAPAQASFYPGHIDPGGTGTVPGFTGDAVFDIPVSCFDGNGWHPTNAFSSSGGCGDAAVYSADINLYTTSPADPPVPGVVIGTFDLSSEPTDFWPILGVLVENGQLAGVDTGQMGPNPGTGAWSGHNFWLQFDSGCFDFSCEIDPPPTATIFMDSLDNPSNPGLVTFGPACDDPNNCFVAQTPEPGSIALMLGALGGGWLARSRRRKAGTEA